MDVSTCNYLVDAYFPSAPSSDPIQPDYMLDDDHWKRIHCESFLDATGSGGILGRAFWVPGGKPSWGMYCLLKKQDWVEEADVLEKFVEVEGGDEEVGGNGEPLTVVVKDEL